MSLQVTEKVTLLPTVGPLKNGANAVHSARSVFDTLGRLLWQKSPRGFITFHHYDLTTNVLLRRIEDVNVAVYSNESGSGEGNPPVPAGWQMPPGGGLHLETVSAHDRQGRVTREAGPVHSVQLSPADAATTPVRQVVYYIYDDAARQRRSAPGCVTAPATGTPDAMHYQWDAWNRLIKITRSSDGATIATHAYDGLTRRTMLTENGTTRHFYYNDQWRSVEERLDDATVPERQHLFNPLNRWHLILRDRDTDANGTLNERLYCLHDAMDPVALTDTTGAVVERYNYSAFGMRRVMDATFADRDTGTAHAWNWDFHGEFSDAASGLHNYGYRFYSTNTGRWTTRDPIGAIDSMNLSVAFRNNSINNIDLHGSRSYLVPNGSGPLSDAIGDDLFTLTMDKLNIKRGFKFWNQIQTPCGHFRIQKQSALQVPHLDSILTLDGYSVEFILNSDSSGCRCEPPCELILSQVISHDGTKGHPPRLDGADETDKKRIKADAKAGRMPYPADMRGAKDPNTGDYFKDDKGEYVRNNCMDAAGKTLTNGFSDAPYDWTAHDSWWYIEVCAFCVNELDEYVRIFGCVRFNFHQAKREIDYSGPGTLDEAPPAQMTSHFQTGWANALNAPKTME